MEQKEANSGMLDLMIQPAFTVKNGIVDQVNEAARAYFLESGMALDKLLCNGKAEYEQMTGGCLYLTLSVGGVPCGVSVRRMDGFDIFTLEQEADQAELQAMALAAQELRMPLANVMTVADQLFPVTDEADDPVIQAQTAKINRGLFQMLRIIGNMSDAYRYSQQTESRLAVEDIPARLQEIFAKSAELLSHGGIQLQFTNTQQSIFGLADGEKLERAVHNMISNAVKFSAKGSPVQAHLYRKKDMLYLSVWGSEGDNAREMQRNMHARYRRQPGLEDSRYGIGLGMVLIRSAAAAHGGTLLVDQPDSCGVRLTMSIAIRQNKEPIVRTNVLSVDYAGERDHALVELSDILPNTLYESPKIN